MTHSHSAQHLPHLAPSKRALMLAFRISWQGALWGFLGFNYAVGIDILSEAYRSLHADVTSSAGRSVKSESLAHILNYFVHLAIVTLWGGYLAGWDQKRTQNIRIRLQPRSTATIINWGMVIFGISISIWEKFFSDILPLRQFCFRLSHRLSQQSLERRKDPQASTSIGT